MPRKIMTSGGGEAVGADALLSNRDPVLMQLSPAIRRKEQNTENDV